MDWQYFPHKHIADLEREFEHKKRALDKLKSMGLDCPYISGTKSYEQLYLDEVQKDFNSNEITYLQEGIIYIFECLMAIEKELPVTEKCALKLLWKEHGDFFESRKKLKGFSNEDEKNMIKNNLNQIIKAEESTFKISTNALSRELAEFKVRLSRRGIETLISNEDIEFLDSRIPVPIPEFEMTNNIEYIEIDNPNKEKSYPDIFRDEDAYLLFEKLHAIYKNIGNQLANYSFIYRVMFKDGLILESVKPNKFIDFIMSKPYEIEYLPKLKSYSEACENKAEKLSFYNHLKNA